MPLLLQIEELLTANGYGDPEEFLCEWDVAPERWILEMDTYLHPPKVESASTFAMKRPRWLSFSRSNSLCAFFFLLPEGSDSKKTVQCLEIINELHAEFAGGSLCVLDRTVRASGLYIASGQSFSGRQFMYALHLFLGTVAEMHHRFLKEFGAED